MPMGPGEEKIFYIGRETVLILMGQGCCHSGKKEE